MSSPHPLLSVRTDRRGTAAIIRLVGEVDLATAPTVEDAVTACLAASPGPELLVLDLGGVEFFGSTGLAALLTALSRCRELGIALRLVVTNRLVYQPLLLTGLSEVFDIDSSLHEALQAHPVGS